MAPINKFIVKLNELEKKIKSKINFLFRVRHYRLLQLDRIKQTKLHEPWKDFQNFYKDNFIEYLQAFFEAVDKENHELSVVTVSDFTPTFKRLNIREDYYPGNTKWICHGMAATGRESTKIASFQGKDYTVSKLAKKLKCPTSAIYQRLRTGEVSDADLLSITLRRKGYMPNKNAKMYSYKGAPRTGIDLERISKKIGVGVKRTTIIARIDKYGYTPEEAVSKPSRQNK